MLPGVVAVVVIIEVTQVTVKMMAVNLTGTWHPFRNSI